MKNLIFLLLAINSISCSVINPPPKNTPITTSASVSTTTPEPTNTLIPTLSPTPIQEKTSQVKSSSKKCRIAFNSSRDGYNSIYSMNTDGTDVKNLTKNSAGDNSFLFPTWSPDSARIAFYSSLNGKDGIYIMNADGSNLYFLTSIFSDSFDILTWSPDGTQIAFSDYHSIYVVNSDGSNLNNLTSKILFDEVDTPSWSPDGKRIAFSSVTNGNSEIYIIDLDSSNEFGTKINGNSPAWSPDGKNIIFSAGCCGHPNISIMNADGSNVKILASYEKNTEGILPSWSPNGKKIAFYSRRYSDDEMLFEINIMDIDGNNLHSLVGDKIDYYGWQSSNAPSWSSDGSKIVFYAKNQNGYSDIYEVNIDGTNLHKLTNSSAIEADDWAPVWSPACK